MQTLTEVRRLAPKGAAVFASRVAALKLNPLGVQFTGGAIDGDVERAARERISEIDRRLALLRAGVVADREQAQEETRELTNERAGHVSKLGVELGVFVCPRAGEVTLSPGTRVNARAVLEFLRGHHLREDAPTDGGTFYEVTA
jgi:hypothetical protein